MNLGTQDVGVSITATGTTQGTAALLINGISWITSAAANSGVILNTGGQGTSQVVYNGSANVIKVYPPTSAQINGLPVNTGNLLAPGTVCVYWTLSAVQMIGILSA